ncbi:MAG: hypothetical protein BRD40_01930 [Bacteroidetes bacterium QS_1_65_9]|nr:MAG: hypothetical protein BRD40_01930 [Bacteroidetes bacterium QS_1_65_9]
MIWLYRLQQRFSITQIESLVLLALVGLFNVGLAVRYVQEQPRPIPPETYRAGDRLFARGAAQSADSLAAREPVENMPQPDASEPPAEEAPVRVNINAASSERLQRLNGVGPATAARILAYRERRGGFRRKRDLTRVSGIGPKTLQKLQPHVTLTES